MFEAPAVLQFDLEPGQNADAVLAARALITWVEAIQEAAAIIDPLGGAAVDLVSAEAACLRFRTVLRFVEQKTLAPVADYLAPYPRIKQLIALNILVLPVAVGSAVIADHLSSPEAQEKQAQVARSPVVQQKVRSFYKIVEQERSVTRISVSEHAGGVPVLSVPRAEFAERSGLWSIQDGDTPTRPGGGVWDVVVTHPVSIAKPLTWGFMRDGLPFRAKMKDERFLAAIRSGTLPLTIQEGVLMKVRVSFTEELDGQTWVPVAGTWKIEEVLSPRP